MHVAINAIKNTHVGANILDANTSTSTSASASTPTPTSTFTSSVTCYCTATCCDGVVADVGGKNHNLVHDDGDEDNCDDDDDDDVDAAIEEILTMH